MYRSAHLFALLESGGDTFLAYCNITFFIVDNKIIVVQYNIKVSKLTTNQVQEMLQFTIFGLKNCVV